MMIECLKLRDFRNYASLEIHPHAGVNLFFGQNGAGKTNLLEAVHYCALGRSHRTSQDRDVVRRGALMGACGVVMKKKDGRADVAVKLTPGEARKKQIFIDHKKVSRLSDMMGQVQCVIFSPEDLMLVKEGPAGRRRFLDMMLSQLSTGYFVALQQYQKALDQRNAVLRDMKKGGGLSEGLLIPFEEAMSRQAAVILPLREKIVLRLNQEAARRYAAISGREGERFDLRYLCCMDKTDNVMNAYADRLARGRREDIFRGVTCFGLHREDVAMTLSQREMKLFASQGQIRTAALSMKLAQLEVFKQESGETPILLLDDVMSELDMTRRTRLLEEISQVQTFVTCTDETDLEGCHQRRSYLVQMEKDGCASLKETSGGEIQDVMGEHDEPDFS